MLYKMSLINSFLEPIPEISSSDDSNNNINNINKLMVEIIYYPDNIPPIKSYYLMNQVEYDNLINLHIDLFIENFINDENINKDNLDIHIINNSDNIELCKKFISVFGNTFDILSYLLKKKSTINDNPNIGIYYNNYSDSDSLSETNLKNNSDENIDTITEVIDSYNKLGIINKDKISNLINNNINDDIINEINNK